MKRRAPAVSHERGSKHNLSGNNSTMENRKGLSETARAPAVWVWHNVPASCNIGHDAWFHFLSEEPYLTPHINSKHITVTAISRTQTRTQDDPRSCTSRWEELWLALLREG